MKACDGSYYIIVIEDIIKNLIVGSATLVIEQKFIHECSVVIISYKTLYSYFSINNIIFI